MNSLFEERNPMSIIKAFFHPPWITSKEITRVFPDAVYFVVDFPELRAHRYICPLMPLSKVLIPNHLRHALASYFTTRATPIMDSQISPLIQLFIKGRNIRRASIFSSRSSSKHIDRISQSTSVRALKDLASLSQRLDDSNLK